MINTSPLAITIADRRAAALALLAPALPVKTATISTIAIPTGGDATLEATRAYLAARLSEMDALKTGARLVDLLEPIVASGHGIDTWFAHSHNALKMADSGILERVGLHPDTGEVLFRLDPRLARKAVR